MTGERETEKRGIAGGTGGHKSQERGIRRKGKKEMDILKKRTLCSKLVYFNNVIF